MQTRTARHPQPKARPLEHLRVVALRIHVRPNLWCVRCLAPRRADVRDNDGRARPAVCDAVVEDLDEQLLGEAPRERDEALAALYRRAVLRLVVTQVADLVEEVLYAVLEVPDGGLVPVDRVPCGLDDVGCGL